MNDMMLRGSAYKLLDTLGSGASFTAYKAESVSDHKQMIIKQFRNTDNAILQMNRIRDKLHALNRLFYSTEILNTISQIDVIEQDSSLYIIQPIQNGTVMNKWVPRSIDEAIDALIGIAYIIRSFHSNGYLIMDLKPSNLFIMTYPVISVVLFDFDSIVTKDDIHDLHKNTGLIISSTLGYASPKIADIIQNIHSWDELIVGHRIAQIDETDDIHAFGIMIRQFTLDIFPNTDKIIVKKLENIINRATNSHDYKDVNETMEDLKDIQKINSWDIRLSSQKIVDPRMIGRKTELQEIENRLKENNIVRISGMTGIGKKTLAQSYAHKKRSDYDIVQIIPFSGTMFRTIRKIQLSCAIETSDEEFLNILFGTIGQYRKILFIITDVDNELTDINDMTGNQNRKILSLLSRQENVHIIITQTKDDDDNVKLDGIDDNSALNLFSTIYCQGHVPLDEKKKAMLIKRLNEAGNHPEFIKIMATMAAADDINIIIRKDLKELLRSGKKIAYEDSIGYMHDFFANRIKINSISEIQKNIISILYWCGLAGIDNDDLNKCLTFDMTDTTILCAKGIISGNKGHFAMSPFMRMIIDHLIETDTSRCQNFVELVNQKKLKQSDEIALSIINQISSEDSQYEVLIPRMIKEYESLIDPSRMLKYIANYNNVSSLNDETKLMFLSCEEKANSKLGNYDDAIKKHIELIHLHSKNEKDELFHAERGLNKANIYFNKGYYNIAIQEFERCLDTYERYSGQNKSYLPNLVKIYLSLSKSYRNLDGMPGRIEYALYYANRAYGIVEKEDFVSDQKFNVLMEIGDCYRDNGDFDRMDGYYRKAEKLISDEGSSEISLEELYQNLNVFLESLTCDNDSDNPNRLTNFDPLNINYKKEYFIVHSHYSDYYVKAKNIDKALEHCDMYKEYYKDVDEKKSIWDDINREYGYIYYRFEKYEKALEYFENIKQKTINDYNFIGYCHYRLKNFPEAENNLRKAYDRYLYNWNRLNNHILYPDHSIEFAETNRWLAYTNSEYTQYKIAIKHLDIAYKIYKKADQKIWIAECRKWLGYTYYRLSDYQTAKTYLDVALKYYTSIDDKNLVADCKWWLGSSYYDLSDYQTAKTYLDDALKYYTSIDDKNLVADCKRWLGYTYCNLLDYQNAKTYLGDALVYYANINDNEMIANCKKWLGITYHELSDYQTAKTYLDDALKHYTSIDDKNLVADCKRRLGYAYYKLSDYQTAKTYFHDSLQHFKNVNNKDMIAECRRWLGCTYYNLSDYQTAKTYLDVALEYYSSVDVKNLIAECKLFLGKSCMKLQEYDDATLYFNEALSYYTTNPDKYANTISKINKSIDDIIKSASV